MWSITYAYHAVCHFMEPHINEDEWKQLADGEQTNLRPQPTVRPNATLLEILKSVHDVEAGTTDAALLGLVKKAHSKASACQMIKNSALGGITGLVGSAVVCGAVWFLFTFHISLGGILNLV